jgi:nucleoside diphosphate kinase
MRKTAFAATLIAPRLPAAVRKLTYQTSAKTATDATIRMDGLLFSFPA